MVMKTTKTKIALVNTPLLEGAGDHPLFAPLGLAYMSAVLKQNGFEVKVFDCPIYGIDHEKLKSELSAFQPTIVGVGAMTQTFESALKTAHAAKEACPEAKIVMGGPHATFQDKEILSQEKVVDIIVRGEGEETLLELAKQPELQNISEIKGITFRDGQPDYSNANPTLHPKLRRFAASRLQGNSNRKIQNQRKKDSASDFKQGMPLPMLLLRCL